MPTPETENQHLVPRSLSGVKEEFATYQARIAQFLPNFPSSVLEDWLYRHSLHVIRSHGWIEFKTLRFEKVVWPTQKILEVVQAADQGVIWSRKGRLLTDPTCQQDGLGAYMIAEGKWPVPPIVFDNTHGLVNPEGEKLSRFHLFEGHGRLGFLHAINENPEWQAKDKQELWMVSKSQ